MILQMVWPWQQAFNSSMQSVVQRQIWVQQSQICVCLITWCLLDKIVSWHGVLLQIIFKNTLLQNMIVTSF